MKFAKWFKELISKDSAERSFSAEEGEQLRTTFKARYHHFKLLLNANNKALEMMAEMEEALQGIRPFGMSFVQSRATEVSTSVYLIIEHLNALAPGKYGALSGQFKNIQKKINPFLKSGEFPRVGPFVLPIRDLGKDLADRVGAKAANLGEIGNHLHQSIPNGFVITARGYQRFLEFNELQTEIDRCIQLTRLGRLDHFYELSSSIQHLITAAPLPGDLEEAILRQYRLLELEEGKAVTLAMRSSALGEDIGGMSFAGQYRSELNVSGENIVQAYKEIVASKYSLQGMVYRLNRGIRDEDVAMCVICMAMVDAISGGVVYSRNPVNIRDKAIIINSVWGLPKSIVDGSMASDLFIISRDDSMGILRKEISTKVQKFVCYPKEGVCRMDLTGDEGQLASLSDEKAVELACTALKLESHFGTPVDIEWATGKDGSVSLLQCRPLQQMAASKEEGEKATEVQDLGPVVLRGGVTASPGVGAGPAFVVKREMDALQFPDRAVLVAAQASPRWATLLSRASAVVTAQGGIAGHLANVAREFRVPALLGVKGALDALKSGQVVTVDANGLRIYEGEIETLLKQREKPRNLMEGTPVFEALKGAAREITPLNLLDADAPEFRPKNCKTLHDITRFCHEKAVVEMFRFGKDHRFAERSSKQLLCDVPMQFWILNLDDGFKEEETGDKYVRLDNVVSVPMLALWHGMTAIPWEGPPPVDARGFVSVLMEATANPALDPAASSCYAIKNYFMISRNFCTLQSRFGFHFSTVEALVGERPPQNYISFQFKGGAANLARRASRARWIAEILDQYDFRTDVREDALFARLEGFEQGFMEKRLRVLGYLIIHTRQLDMVVSNGPSMDHYRMKVMKDLDNIIPHYDSL